MATDKEKPETTKDSEKKPDLPMKGKGKVSSKDKIAAGLKKAGY